MTTSQVLLWHWARSRGNIRILGIQRFSIGFFAFGSARNRDLRYHRFWRSFRPPSPNSRTTKESRNTPLEGIIRTSASSCSSGPEDRAPVRELRETDTDGQ